MVDNKEVVLAAALVLLYYLFSSSSAEAAVGEGVGGDGSTGMAEDVSGGTGFPSGEGYEEDTSHILIKYPGLQIFTPLKPYGSASYTDEKVAESLGIDIDTYLKTVRKQKTDDTFTENLDAFEYIYIAAPIVNSSNFKELQIISPIKVSAKELSMNGNITIPNIIKSSTYPAEMVNFRYIDNGPDNKYFAVFQIGIRYPKKIPETLNAVELLLYDYAYSYKYLQSVFRNI